MRRILEAQLSERQAAAAPQAIRRPSVRVQPTSVKREVPLTGKPPKVFSVVVAPGSVSIAKFDGESVPNFGEWPQPVSVQKVPVSPPNHPADSDNAGAG